ncbi:MAG: hypothetical protein J3Q66DRAFT_443711 [Benniella sp.]|nr:MAG: hypothetical protein J3Q66DRAFT_443711 [Benniella sp.]
MVVITYCVEYAQSQKSVCQKCNKVIPNKSLRFGRMERQSEKEKKKFAKHTWYHFRCFEVPEVLTKIPIHLIRGQVDLLDKDKLRLERVLKLGVGGSWSQIVEQHQKKTKGAGGEEEEFDEEGNPISTDNAMDVEKDADEEDDDDGTGSKAKDFTAQLTGQADRNRKQKHNNNNNKKQNPLKPNTKGAKVDKTSKQGHGKPGAGAGAAGKGHPSKDAKGTSKGNKDAASKPMSAVEKAIAQSRAQSKKKLEQIQSKFGKK